MALWVECQPGKLEIVSSDLIQGCSASCFELCSPDLYVHIELKATYRESSRLIFYLIISLPANWIRVHVTALTLHTETH